VPKSSAALRNAAAPEAEGAATTSPGDPDIVALLVALLLVEVAENAGAPTKRGGEELGPGGVLPPSMTPGER
jgi:hypothetical protein